MKYVQEFHQRFLYSLSEPINIKMVLAKAQDSLGWKLFNELQNSRQLKFRANNIYKFVDIW